jgi:glycosyltransferase involved in cell wall biosynthesis
MNPPEFMSRFKGTHFKFKHCISSVIMGKVGTLDTQTRFSVLIPVYNRAKLIRETINSVLAQTFTNYEIIVINDGSTDDTLEILENYDSQIRTISQPNQGPESARINGAKIARGEYLAFLDSDDLFLPHTLATYNLILREGYQPEIILGCMAQYPTEHIGDIGKKIADAKKPATIFNYPDFLSKDQSINMSNSKIVIKKTLFEAICPPDRKMEKAFPIDDFNLLMLSGTHGPCIITSEPVTVIHRLHCGNTIANTESMFTGILAFIGAEWKGRYPGGIRRCFDRYARMSGTIFEYLKTALQQKEYRYAYKLFITGWPMIVVGIIKNTWPWGKRCVPIFIKSD